MNIAKVVGHEAFCGNCRKKLAEVFSSGVSGVEIKCRSCGEVSRVGGPPRIETKVFEVRDRATHIGALATRMVSSHPAERYELRRNGYGEENPLILVVPLSNVGQATYNEHRDDGTRTMMVAHKHIAACWNDLASGDVIDVEYLLEEKSEPSGSERIRMT